MVLKKLIIHQVVKKLYSKKPGSSLSRSQPSDFISLRSISIPSSHVPLVMDTKEGKNDRTEESSVQHKRKHVITHDRFFL
jgi:hypothetical protein